ncbi:PqiA/YebS family transporter subunit [Pseudoalteromonas luteoviolacea]|uniref:paraquat-inducible protein A n=1 Tax=Pseudoalteromonas luteoviolacea TaxID=43657 RepID=UPI0007B09D49|nr:PqiA/YebS family transporter subunit [Pseudoalteromonas luteoviolacea]
MIIACQHCDHLVSIAQMGKQQRAVCPHCGNVLANCRVDYNQSINAFGLSSILFLLVSLHPHFISYAQHGLKQSISLIEAISLLATNFSALLAGLLSFTILVMPMAALLLILLAHSPLWKHLNPHNARIFVRALMLLKPLNLADIFLVAVLISAFKLTEFAEIEVGLGFWAYVLFVLCFIETLSLLSKEQLWEREQQTFCPDEKTCSPRALQQNLKQCHVCGQLSDSVHCPRCMTKLKFRKTNSLAKSTAWMITAMVLLIPALALPIMDTINLGLHTKATIYSGVEVMWHAGSYPVAILIFVASICIPIVKGIALFYLVYQVRRCTHPKLASKLYRALEFMGKWSMIDVFVVILLVSLVQLGTVLSVEPQSGIVFFTAMVLCQIISVNHFDPRLLWDNLKQQ